MVVISSFNDILNELSQGLTVSLPALKQNGLKIEYSKDDEIEVVYSSLSEPPLPFAASDVYDAGICDWRRLTSEGASKTVYEVTFDVQGSNFNYKGGDTIGIIPHNVLSEVEKVLEHLNLKSLADIPYRLTVKEDIKGSKIPQHIPIRSTLRHVLSKCVDLRSTLKKLFLLALSRYTKDERERKVLEYLCSKEGSESYHRHILNKGLTMIDIFNIFKTCKPPVEIILANLPRLLPRPYSIVNSGIKNSSVIKICFSVMNIGHNRKGLTTGWLEQLITEESELEDSFKHMDISDKSIERRVPIYMRKNLSVFALPENLDRPMILIGPGTGVAPYLGFLEEIKVYKDDDPNLNIGEVWLYFGNRHAKLDFIYEKELSRYLEDGILTCMKTAFSKMEESNYKYIQDLLTADGKNIVKLMKDGAYIFVCGDLKNIAAQVKEVLVNSLVKYDGKGQEEAEKYICDMQKNRKYLIDAWS